MNSDKYLWLKTNDQMFKVTLKVDSLQVLFWPLWNCFCILM
ncbi:hypothetical protein PTRA_a1335 [Pseudoalteromonas translucida KMM 520]|uniref:Uncharacterized protein n=1 Tax=Pseudoalteromonas translucida KMM 520 TaxID=1315283 RepID=A0A0U2X1C0_9GAMM|nr:hypothetical protein PTRA_a1335 [Pseudoalteromonas translucida KMM 520]